MENKKKNILMIIAFAFTIALVSVGTYAIWNVELFTDINVITTGQIKMSYTETNEIVMENAIPIKDEEGKILDNYFDFQVLTYVKTKDNDRTKRKVGYNVILEPITVDNPLSDNEVKVYLTKVENGVESVLLEPTTIDRLNDYVINSKEEIFRNNKGEVITSYRLRTWIDENVDTSKFSDKKYSYKFRININTSDVVSELPDVEPNAPELTSNMIPVYYDLDNEVWKKADVDNTSNSWYDYENKMWANAVTVTSANRETYLNADVDTEIPMSDINTMWVWIPRFRYTYFNSNTPEEIKVRFEDGINSTGTIKCVDALNQTDSDGNVISQTCTDTVNDGLVIGKSTYTHPAFTFDGEELKGIWVGKFEVSSDTNCNAITGVAMGSSCNQQNIRPLIKPDVKSWRGAQTAVFFNGIYNMRESGNQYGFKTTDETHMIKNSEWGAIAYLSHSKYGINKEINLNNSSDFYTGRSGGSGGGSTRINVTYPDQTSVSTFTKAGFYTYDGYLLEYNKNTKTTTKDMSKIASTTGNITGIYDMAGGAWEYTMAGIVDSDGNVITGSSKTSNKNSAFTGVFSDGTSFTGTFDFPDSKYYDFYSYNAKSNAEFTRGKLGDSTIEVTIPGVYKNWYGDSPILVYANFPMFLRGGSYGNGENSGAFNFHYTYGHANSGNSTRAVISNK